MGEPWLEHDERYRRSEEFITALEGIWTGEGYTLGGNSHRFRDSDLKPEPLSSPGRPHPEVVQGGNSTAARQMAGRVSDRYSSHGTDRAGIDEQIRDVRAVADRLGRRVSFGLDGFVIARDTEAEAHGTLREIVATADEPAVEGFPDAVQQAGSSTGDEKGMGADSSFEDLVQYDDGFTTNLIGTSEQIAERIVESARHGVDLVLTGFLHFQEEIEHVGAKVLPLVREMEQAAGSAPTQFQPAAAV